MNHSQSSFEDFKAYLKIEDTTERVSEIDAGCMRLRKYGTLENFLECENLFVELLLNYPSRLPLEITLPEVIYTLV